MFCAAVEGLVLPVEVPHPVVEVVGNVHDLGDVGVATGLVEHLLDERVDRVDGVVAERVELVRVGGELRALQLSFAYVSTCEELRGLQATGGNPELLRRRACLRHRRRLR